MAFPKHVSFTLEHNSQNVIYQTVDDFLANQNSFTLKYNPQNVLDQTVDDFLANQKAIDERIGFCNSPDFESEDHRVLSVISDELWTLRYYPGNSVAIYLAAPSLEELIIFAKRLELSDGQ